MAKRGDQPVDEVFAPPRPLKDTDASAWDVWREGITLVAHQGGQLPKRCVRCNQKTQRRVRLLLTNTPLWVRGFGWIAPIVHPLLRLIATQRGELTVGVCDTHHRDWMLNRVFSIVLFLALMALLATHPSGELNLVLYVTVAFASIGFLVTVKSGALVRLVAADDNFVRVTPSQNFLDSFEDEREYEDEDEEWDDESDA